MEVFIPNRMFNSIIGIPKKQFKTGFTFAMTDMEKMVNRQIIPEWIRSIGAFLESVMTMFKKDVEPYGGFIGWITTIF